MIVPSSMPGMAGVDAAERRPTGGEGRAADGEAGGERGLFGALFANLAQPEKPARAAAEGVVPADEPVRLARGPALRQPGPDRPDEAGGRAAGDEAEIVPDGEALTTISAPAETPPAAALPQPAEVPGRRELVLPPHSAAPEHAAPRSAVAGDLLPAPRADRRLVEAPGITGGQSLTMDDGSAVRLMTATAVADAPVPPVVRDVAVASPPAGGRAPAERVVLATVTARASHFAPLAAAPAGRPTGPMLAADADAPEVLPEPDGEAAAPADPAPDPDVADRSRRVMDVAAGGRRLAEAPHPAPAPAAAEAVRPASGALGQVEAPTMPGTAPGLAPGLAGAIASALRQQPSAPPAAATIAAVMPVQTSAPGQFVRSVAITLQMPEHGAVDVRMSLAGSALTLQFTAERAETAERLRHDSAALHQALSEHGYDASILRIDTRPGAPQAADAPRADAPAAPGGNGHASGQSGGERQPYSSDRRPAPQGEPPSPAHAGQAKVSHEATSAPRGAAGRLYV